MQEESKRQKQVAQLINEELNAIFLREGLNTADGGLISIAGVKVTPDLLEARIYLSLFQVKDEGAYMEHIEKVQKEIRHQLGNKIKNQMRKIPELRFFKDDTLDYVFKMEEIFKSINEKKKD